MTFDKYVKAMEEYENRLNNIDDDEYDDIDDLLDEISKFQYEYMRNVLNEYVVDSEVKQACYEILDDAVNYLQTGQGVCRVENKELADEVAETIFNDFGDYMLEYPDCYEDCNGEWVVDCIFGGYFIPEWDGWFD